ncbi:hypothetical protein ABT023_12720 [Micromonospora sp. NPDC002296]|uniref:hypothetical protein n=1 Tax=Micromonospora sp. NPDC002296 TaxID=3154271 RepID=UPI00332CE0EF
MADDSLFVVCVVLNAVLSVYALWQVVVVWRAKRRGEHQKRLMMTGAARLLLSSAMWITIFLYTPFSHDFGPMTGIVALVACLALLTLAVLVDCRRRQLTRSLQR